MEPNNPNRIIRLVVVTVAIAVPVLPIVVWAQSAVPIYRSMWHGPLLLLYLPARMLGLIGFVMMFYQFVMAARFGVIERAFTRAVIYRRHRTLGKIGFLLILAHGVAMLGFDIAMAGTVVWNSGKVVGLIALTLLSISVAVAIFWKRLNLTNRQWMRIHRLAWIVFPLALHHAVLLGTTINTSRWVLMLFYLLAAGYALLLVRRIAQVVKGRQQVKTRSAPAAASD